MLYLYNSFSISLALIKVRQEGRGNCTTIQRMTQPLKIQQKLKQLGPRWQKIQLSVHLEPHYILIVYLWFVSFQSLSCFRLFATPWTAAHQASLLINNSQSLLKLMSIKSLMPSNHLILQPSIFPSIKVFSNESVFFTSGGQSIGVFSFNVSSSNEYSGLISFRIDWSDLLALQGILKSPLQHSSKALILRCSAFFIVQLSHPKKQESSRKTSTSALLTTPKPLIVWITRNCRKFFKRWAYQTT